jgi:hypothetical protein
VTPLGLHYLPIAADRSVASLTSESESESAICSYTYPYIQTRNVVKKEAEKVLEIQVERDYGRSATCVEYSRRNVRSNYWRNWMATLVNI